MPAYQLPCLDPAHLSRGPAGSNEPDWTEKTSTHVDVPEGQSPTPQQLAIAGRCKACARLHSLPLTDAALLQMVLGYLFAPSESKNGPGALSLATFSHRLTAVGAADALTVANGVRVGQLKTIRAVAGHDAEHTSVLIPANRNGYSTITFSVVGQWIVLRWQADGWTILWQGGGTNGSGPTIA